MGKVVPIHRHRLQLNHCPACDAEIEFEWLRAMDETDRRYAEREAANSDELEPRMDTRWERDDTEDDNRGLW